MTDRRMSRERYAELLQHALALARFDDEVQSGKSYLSIMQPEHNFRQGPAAPATTGTFAPLIDARVAAPHHQTNRLGPFAMNLLRKPLSDVELGDLEQLVEAAARETGELEFKGSLPFRQEKGSAATADRWIEKGDRLGTLARDELLAELIAFANAEGGTLVLGLHETKEEPRTADHLEPLPNCEGLARRIVDSAEDLVEPRMPALEAKSVPAADNGAGYVVLRAAKSPFGPHRLKSTREFYVRRGERATVMDVREIKETTLSLARTGDRVEELFQERQEASRREFLRLQPATEGQYAPFLIRATALPASIQAIPGITARPDLWWMGDAFNPLLDGQAYDCGYPASLFNHRPEVRLRALQTRNWGSVSDREVSRMLRGDGAIEFIMASDAVSDWARAGRVIVNRVYYSWIIGLAVGAMCQVEHLRRRLAWDGVLYGMDVEIHCGAELALWWGDRGFSSSDDVAADPLRLPRYEIGQVSEFDAVVTSMVTDLSNAWHRKWEKPITVPWTKLLP